MERIQTRAATRALENNIVLEKIARSLPPKDLLRLRPTCRGWNRHFVPEIRSRHEILKFYSHYQLSEFTACLQSSSPVPFSKLSIPYPNAKSEGYPLLREFFSVCGAWVTYLEVKTPPYPPALQDTYALRRAIFELTPALRNLTLDLGLKRLSLGRAQAGMTFARYTGSREIPQLKRLELRNCGTSNGSAPRRLFNDLVRNAVCLENLVLDDTSASVALSALLDSYQQGAQNLCTLTSLELEGTLLCADDLQKLLELGSREAPLQLKLFTQHGPSLRPRTGVTPRAELRQIVADLLSKFLATQSATLEELSISYATQVPILPHTRKLRISLWPSSLGIVRFETGTLALNFPALKDLDFRFPHHHCPGDKVPGYHLPLGPVLAHDGVTSLSFSGKLDGNTLPSVTHCKLSLAAWGSGSGFGAAAIWTAWPRLLSLHLECGTASNQENQGPNLDELLTGVPESRFTELRSLVARWDAGVTMSSSALRAIAACRYTTNPGLSNLSHLQRFTLDIGNQEDAETLTDIGGYFGLSVASRSLQYVGITFPSIYRSGCLVSARDVGLGFLDECVRFIRDSLDVLTVVEIEYKHNL